MKIAFLVLLVIHGAIHLIGFAKAFGLADVAHLPEAIGRPLGLLWLAAGLGFAASAVVLVVAPGSWWMVAAPALVASQLAILSAWPHAKPGTLVNAIVLVPLTLALLDLRPSSFRSIYHGHVARGLARTSETAPVTEADLATLPPVVQTYLRRVGVVGRPRVRDFRAVWRGEMRLARDGPWMGIRAEQYDFLLGERSRVFRVAGRRYGLPFEALHVYAGAFATMRVRVASLLEIVDARGPEMDRSETVTLFNDMCLLAPGSLVGADVRWREIDAGTVRATFTNAGHSITAELHFDQHGDLVDFTSDDRDQSADGKTYRTVPWSTPVRDHRDYRGLRLPSHGDAVWHEADGDYVYARFDLEEIDLDVGAARRRDARGSSMRVTMQPVGQPSQQ